MVGSMTAREQATLWIVALVGIAIIIYDHRIQTLSVLQALALPSGAPPSTVDNSVITGNALGTNNPMPIAAKGTTNFGLPLVSDDQNIGYSTAFDNVWSSLQ
jgi:hypothetical protein